jgi:diketogulonate reductase-like aldo/keto reductase
MDEVPKAIETSLKKLQLDYADVVSYIKPHW